MAEHDRRFYGLEVDWQTEVLVTSGATEALADCFLGLLEPGDEVVLLEPLYDSYLPIIERAGAVPCLVRLEPPEWRLPRRALEAAFTAKTKLLVLNSPLNPIGKVFDEAELSFLARLLQAHDAYVICDEVYEHLVFDGSSHVPLLTLPGMRDRCLRIGSAGKTFSATGWKVGWVTGSAPLIEAVDRGTSSSPSPRPPICRRRWPSGSDRTTAISAAWRSRSRVSATASRRGSPPPASGCCPAPAPTFSSPTSKPSGA